MHLSALKKFYIKKNKNVFYTLKKKVFFQMLSYAYYGFHKYNSIISLGLYQNWTYQPCNILNTYCALISSKTFLILL